MSKPYNPIVERALKALEEAFGTPRQPRRRRTGSRRSTRRPAQFRPGSVRGPEQVVSADNPDVCFHCRGEKACRCAGCAVPAGPMTWEPGECQSCKGTGYLADAVPAPTATPEGCPGPEKCAGCYSVGVIDGRERFIHPPKGKAIEWPKLATEKLQ